MGSRSTVKIEHDLPDDLGEQVLTFDVPADVPGGIVSFAAFVGEDFQTSLQHIESNPQPAR